MPPKSHAEMITATVKKSPIVRQVAVCSHEHTFVAPCRALEGLVLHQIPGSYLGVWVPGAESQPRDFLTRLPGP
jgi:hypothetical protein